MYMSFHVTGVVIHTTDAEAQAATNAAGDTDEMTIIENSLPSLQQLKDLKMTPLDFEKVIIIENYL